MRGKKRKNYPPRKKNKVKRERAIESHSKDKKNSSPESEKSSDVAEKKTQDREPEKSLAKYTKVEIQNQKTDQEEADLKNLIWIPA